MDGEYYLQHVYFRFLIIYEIRSSASMLTMLLPRMTCVKVEYVRWGLSMIPLNNGKRLTYDHANVVLLAGAHFFNGIVENNVHEGVIATQDSNNLSGSIKLQGKALFHISKVDE
jgi:hypothetical protein